MDGSSILPFGSLWKTSKEKFKSYSNASRRWRTAFDFGKKEQRIGKIEKLLEDPLVWENQDQGTSLVKEAAELKKELGLLIDLKKRIKDAKELVELLKEDETMELEQQVVSLDELIYKAELQMFLSGKYDKGNAILTVTAGAGGQDAQDWATMLQRMYVRYAERKGWHTKEISHSPIQATFEVQGPNAYGFLCHEAGVHRLVRISPFSAKQLRHTSFASLEVLPVIDRAKEKDIVIAPDDIKIDTFHASGPGGQYVNKRETAIRITHVPTKMVVSSQTQRSLQQNKDKALAMLAAKLYDKKKREEEKELTLLKGEKKSIEWGSQVRSYVLQPYQLVKDHRTNIETTKVESVLSGELDEFIEAELKM